MPFHALSFPSRVFDRLLTCAAFDLHLNVDDRSSRASSTAIPNRRPNSPLSSSCTTSIWTRSKRSSRTTRPSMSSSTARSSPTPGTRCPCYLAAHSLPPCATQCSTQF
jgi:hypothetical protein